MLIFVFFGLFAMHQASGVIHRLTRLEYEKLPPLVSVDPYGPCMHNPGDLYCMVSLQLHGNRSDPIYNLIEEYSANNITHFDHKHMYRGVCPKRSCQQYMNTSPNLTEAIEACFNDTLTKQYSLTSKIYNIACEDYKERLELDGSDYAFVIIVLILLGLNSAGTIYDFHGQRGKDTLGGRMLLCFSVRVNWRSFAKPGSSSPMQRRIRGIYGIKTITAFLVILAHAPLPAMLLGNNPQYLEESYHNILYHTLYNGTLVVQTFFIISAFLMAYNMFRSEEKTPPKWQNLHLGIIHRWLRLTPAYALVTFYVMTWARYTAAGPFNMYIIQADADACRRDWWRHLLYLHNYKDGSQCMAHTWYLAADFQLYFVGLMVFCLLFSQRARKLAIAALMVIGLITPAVHTFVQNLHAVLVVSPEVALNFFVNDPTFNNLYKRGHTNLSGFALGLGFAYIANSLKDSDIGSKKYKKYHLLYWFTFPMKVCVCFLGYVFYIDGIVVPLGVRVVYSSIIKLAFGSLSVLFIFLTIVKADRAIRGVLNWSGWVRLSRISYCAFLVHVPLLRYMASSTDVPVHAGFPWQMQNYFSNLVMSYIVGLLLFVVVEAPLGEFARIAMNPVPRKRTEPAKMDNACSKETIEVKL